MHYGGMTLLSYRLDPRFPVVWRDPLSLQVGVDHALATFAGVTNAQQTMLHALQIGVGAGGLQMLSVEAGGAHGEAARLLEKVKPALENAHGSPFAGADIAVQGVSPAAVSLRRLFAQLVALGGNAAATRLESSPDIAVLVAPWAVRPSAAAHWLRRDVPHLLVVFSDQEARIGPLVTPGNGPCSHCAERWASERDESWPAIASQLLGRRALSEEPLLVASVTSIAARLVRSFLAEDGRSLRPGRVLHINAASGLVTETLRLLHPACACRALPRNEKEHESAPGSRPSPTTIGRAVGALA